MPLRAPLPVSKALRKTHSYLRLRHSRLMKTLSIQRPRPSMEMRIPASFSVVVKAKLVNWLPWSAFCLSSGYAGLIDLPVAPRDNVEDLPRDGALEGPDCIQLGMSFGDAFGNRGLCGWIGLEPSAGDDVEGAVCSMITAPVECGWSFRMTRGPD